MAVGVCARCGAFACEACCNRQLDALHCAACIAYLHGPAPLSGPRDPWLSAVGWLSLLVPLLGIYAVVAGRRRHARIRAGEAPWSQYADATTAVGLGVGSLVLWVVGPGAFLLLVAALGHALAG